MLRQRTVLTLIFLPVIVAVMIVGGWLFTVGVSLVLALASYEYAEMYAREGLRPSRVLLLAGVVVLSLTRQTSGFVGAPLLLTILILAAMAWHLVDFERGAVHSGTDFALTVTGMLYIGWLGSFLVSLRTLPEGKFWLSIALPSIWFADTGAYLIGSAIGHHKLVPRLSPKKSWEGYLAGIVTGTLAGWGLAVWLGQLAGPATELTPAIGVTVGLVVSVLAPLGDLGISMMKRELHLKDTGQRLAGHGGFLDRIDTWLWAGALGFYTIILLVP
ncbi:MAG: phosphatidate cytidylyltransferase [Anaerolineales bacterium]